VATVERRNVQGLVFHSYGRPRSRLLLFALGGAAEGRAFLAALLPVVTHAAQDPAAAADPLLNLSLSWTGLRALGGSEDADFASEFKVGPEAGILGDAGDSAPTRWWNGRFETHEVHLVVHLHARSAASLEAATADVRREAAAAGLRELLPAENDGGALSGRWLSPGGRELHFGYLDGFSQPAVNWEDAPDRPDLLDLRHVVLGYANAAVPSRPQRAPWVHVARDGSYAVLRWLRQDVAAFEAFLTEQGPRAAPHLPPEAAREWLAAKLMGRWRDGTPVALSPDHPDPALAGHDFSYADDPAGLRCPLAAHVRIAHRRDDPLSVANVFGPGQPRIVRRGMSYGPRYVGDGDAGVDRGIVGLFLCASINRQFYPLTRWMHTTNFRDAFRGEAQARQDPIVGNRAKPRADASFAIPTPAGEVVLRGLPDFVRTKGTLFLLMPGLSGLARLAGTG
jgi:deferrochelatase/peroxidase EfeB